jgi:hypothetical protein
LAFVGPTKGSTAKAVRYTLFGPIWSNENSSYT